VQERGILETRLTVACDDDDLRCTLDIMAGPPQGYFCYCLAEFDRALDVDTLQVIWQDFKQQRDPLVHALLHFAMCKESTAAVHMHINIHRFEDNVSTIPLERDETRRAILNGTAAHYVQGKVSAWMDNHRLFATTQPVVREGEFFGRQDELGYIRANVKNHQSFHLVGLPRMGKTSLVEHLHNIGAFRNHLYAYLDLESHVVNANFDRAIGDILDQWSEAFQRRYPQQVDLVKTDLSPPASCFEQLQHFLDALQRIRNETRLDIPCLVVFDDVNVLFREREDRLGSLWACGASHLIRLLRTRQLVTMVLTAQDYHTLNRIEAASEGSGGLGSDIIDVSPLKYEDCSRMITYIGGIINMAFENASLEAIYTETGGHPLWTRLLCDSISTRRQNRQERITVTPADVEQAANRFVSVHERLITRSLATLTGEEKQVRDQLVQSDKPLMFEDFSPPVSRKALEYLEHYGLIERTAGGAYQPRMQVVVRYVKRV